MACKQHTEVPHQCHAYWTKEGRINMQSKSFVIGSLLVVILGVIFWFVYSRSQDGGPSDTVAQTILNATYSQNAGEILNLSHGPVGKLCPVWLPMVSAYLQQNYGAVKGIKTESHTKKPASARNDGRYIETRVYQVSAERGSYEMLIAKTDTDDKVKSIWFKFPPSTQWTDTIQLALQNGQ